MLNYVTSNFGLSVVIALVSSLVLYMLNRNQPEQISYMVYLKKNIYFTSSTDTSHQNSLRNIYL